MILDQCLSRSSECVMGPFYVCAQVLLCNNWRRGIVLKMVLYNAGGRMSLDGSLYS